MIAKIESPGGTEESSISLEEKYAYFPTPGTQFGKIPESPQVLISDTAIDKIVARIALESGALSTYVAGDGKILVGEDRYVNGAAAKRATVRARLQNKQAGWSNRYRKDAAHSARFSRRQARIHGEHLRGIGVRG
ncbi:uncharacterized protein Z519_10397 [Cladophialophora bantiana CBS 173.52]|uniref:Uncharacterized protein n=1 Tax=Cladophialophora bantiana (strain ATCC 10958 / CBS 173.52 / CDC B-1940 / NIH 8579) TaxID=1442370 RepID=A0A0D2H6G7_CLAB1|nr:uncharacterized protein Z519_10397 [Cladophialophora bantiana CBS 173.52]KIW88913.1 hypothetical protein Z519_10397 [Cladophialophora bantiana CBS 173.52]